MGTMRPIIFWHLWALRAPLASRLGDIDTDSQFWVVVKIIVPFWVLNVIRHLGFRESKRGP